jgi:hypothetical protein
LPRWGSRVRIPSSAQEKAQVRAGVVWPSCICGAFQTVRGPVGVPSRTRLRHGCVGGSAQWPVQTLTALGAVKGCGLEVNRSNERAGPIRPAETEAEELLVGTQKTEPAPLLVPWRRNSSPVKAPRHAIDRDQPTRSAPFPLVTPSGIGPVDDELTAPGHRALPIAPTYGKMRPRARQDRRNRQAAKRAC